jgi:hypothetical protein
MKKKFPVVPDDLLKALEEAFPDKAPRNRTMTQVDLGICIGEQRVMDLIRRAHAQQNILEG